MKFHYISSPTRSLGIRDSLKKACDDRGIEFVQVNPWEFDYTDKSRSPSAGDIVYRAETCSEGDGVARTVERWLVNEDSRTLYMSYKRALSQYPGSHIMHEKAGLSVPACVWTVRNDRKLLDNHVDYVGGMPVILKVTGGSHGVGVIKVDSKQSLYSIVDYFNQNGVNVMMKRFIETKSSARLVVLGDKIVGSLEYTSPDGDFRTNVGDKFAVKEKYYSDEINDLAVKAVEALDLFHGGVDIMIGKDGTPYIAECNFPCNYHRVEQVAGINISGKLLDFLINKD